MARIETREGALARRGFTAAESAVRILRGWDERYAPLLELVSGAADPDHALAALDRLRDADPQVLDRLIERPEPARRLIAVLGASATLANDLVAHPDRLDRLGGPPGRVPAAELRSELLTAVGADPHVPVPVATDLTGDQLRTAYRTAVLRIAARDLTADDPTEVVDDIAGELADLADATLEGALAVARAKVGPDALLCRIAVIALGKCGAQELNYVSDVDVLYVAEPALDGDGEPMINSDRAITIATLLASELSRICSAHTAAGTIWPVDAALRPEGKAGQLVRTLTSHRGYYEKWAKTWEFQAMLKARPSAGDLALGQEFVDLVTPLVWRAGERQNFIADTQAMRRRVVDLIPARDAERELKLGEGGLRDVEFSVQLLQLVHGRADERLRARATLPSLQALIDNGYVGREDGRRLDEAYRFLRALEHRIQLYRLRRTHVLPQADDDLRRLGRSLGYADPVATLLSTWRSYSRQVRRLHQRIFYSPLLDAVARIPSSALRLTTDAAVDRLRALGYADPAAALRHIAALSQGVSRSAEIQRQLLPAMLGWFAEGPNPDHGLLAFRQVSEALGSTPWYLRALRDEGLMAERLARILASSRYAVQLLTRSPQTVQMLADDTALTPRPVDDLRAEMRAAAGRHETPRSAVEAIRAIRRRELFRIAAGDLLDVNDVDTVGEALTDLAAATIDVALTVARNSISGPVPEMALIAMGRWGGRELSYASDADTMFVMADSPDPGATDRAVAVISALRDLLAKPGVDPSLIIDAALRPEGKQGPLIRSLSAYQKYYRQWSSTWELQALIRADALAGDHDLGQALLAEIDLRRWPADGLSDAQLLEIRRLKARVESERLPRGADPAKHTKLGPGGLADVEWTVQLLQLQHAGTEPSLRTTRTLTALDAAERAGLILPDDADALRQAWLFASRVRNQLMLLRGRGSDSLPSDTRELAALAHLMGFGRNESSHLEAEYRRLTRRARAVVDRLFWNNP
ncbi:bifunctional [glutamine synthetase] adenylyltransferase/[glutamine synthetase]-adenylyl-L-tyrosine phosphorylase [Microlunatus parietis]|uniref:Bifunctional glutamine synthetase adenylyltransferase/adenylyl-removing enzyme n=1 Tax=Microlunatus parietis TaxID=682979 RepID=A0A7Y9I6L4_9ACTN|nr:bifunctional [glutamine synthetase] adenylyltransferase/[glutamine synthetase]-adenylyl-L-tyrosine phosphorylase [Microlunatus parietis]NYE70956.1 glutamate-ammonia-ligase adenylyltransferase [Microlunatus parietis]